MKMKIKLMYSLMILMRNSNKIWGRIRFRIFSFKMKMLKKMIKLMKTTKATIFHKFQGLFLLMWHL